MTQQAQVNEVITLSQASLPCTQVTIRIGAGSPLVEKTFRDCLKFEDASIQGDGKQRCPIVIKIAQSYIDSLDENRKITPENYPVIDKQEFGRDRSGIFNDSFKKEQK